MVINSSFNHWRVVETPLYIAKYSRANYSITDRFEKIENVLVGYLGKLRKTLSNNCQVTISFFVHKPAILRSRRLESLAGFSGYRSGGKMS
jgi:hypothetical protein